MGENARTKRMIMKNKLMMIMALPPLILVLVACKGQSNGSAIGETELYFEEKLASLSAGNNGTVWVGSENGRLWRVKGNHSEAFDVGEGRIYKVVPVEEKDWSTSLWIGARNSGLQKWEMKDGSLNKRQTYLIPLKGSRYSSYDMAKIQHSMYVATTQGLYQVSLSVPTDSMSLLYPSQEALVKEYDYSFVVNNLLNYKDSILWAATQHGALQLNLDDGHCKIFYPELSISHVSMYNDTLFILSDNILYFNTVEGKPLGKVKLQFSPKVYYQTAGVHYMADRDNILLSTDFKDFTLIPLRRKIANKCRNIMLPDPGNDFMLLLMEDALWRIPNHSGVLNGNSSVKAACAEDGCAYYLTSDNELYYQRKGASEALPIYSFPKEEQLVWMRACGGKLYYYNTKQDVKELTISRFPLKNLLFHSSRSLYQSKQKITSAYLEKKAGNQQLYLGVQDGLLLLDTHQKVDTLSDFAHRYVTSFFSSVHSDVLYLSTLNSGLFYRNSDLTFKRIPDTSLHSYAKDIIVTNDYPPRLVSLTNHDILLQGSADSILARGYNKLLYANDTLFYALSEFGIRKITIDREGCLQDKGCFYTDIRFNPAAAFVWDNRLYLGSNLGVLTMNVDEESNSTWVSFQPNVLIGGRYILILSCLLCLCILFAIYRFVGRKHASKKRLTKRIAYLKACAEELTSFYNLSDDEEERRGIEQLTSAIANLNIDTATRKELNIQIGKFTEEIIQRNRQATLKLLDKLQKQIEWITATHSFDRTQLLHESQDTQKSNDIDRIKKQVYRNEEWMDRYAYLEKEMKQMNEALEGCLSIEGVNDFIMQELNRINEEMGQKPLDELLQTFQTIQSAYELIYSEEAFTTISHYVSGMREYLNNPKEPDVVSCQLVKQLEEVSLRHAHPEDRLQLLKQLGVLTKRVEFLQLKDKLANTMESYTLLRDKMTDENEQLINKKFDKELEACIAKETKGHVEKMERLIVSMYKVLNVTDPVVLTDLLKISSFYHQQAKVLALLIANPRVKRSLIPGMLGVYGNLNPVISRLINAKIKTNEEMLKNYMEEDPLHVTFVYYILKLVE